MKTKLRSTSHSMVPSQTVVEACHDGKLLATITGMGDPGVRIVAKHAIVAS